jgi:hypothetical protein
MDLFKGQLSLDDLLYKEIPLLHGLYEQRLIYLTEKHKAEKAEMDRIQSNASHNKKPR